VKYALATTVVVFLIVLVFVLNALVPLFVDRIQQVLP
jgi:hypothetical protein